MKAATRVLVVLVAALARAALANPCDNALAGGEEQVPIASMMHGGSPGHAGGGPFGGGHPSAGHTDGGRPGPVAHNPPPPMHQPGGFPHGPAHPAPPAPPPPMHQPSGGQADGGHPGHIAHNPPPPMHQPGGFPHGPAHPAPPPPPPPPPMHHPSLPPPHAPPPPPPPPRGPFPPPVAPPPVVAHGQSGRPFNKEVLPNHDVRKTSTAANGWRQQFVQKHDGGASKKVLDDKGQVQSVTRVQVNPVTGHKDVTIQRWQSNGSNERVYPNGARIVTSADGHQVQFVHADGAIHDRVFIETNFGFQYHRTITVQGKVVVDQVENYRREFWHNVPLHVYVTDWNVWGPFYTNPWFHRPSPFIYRWPFACGMSLRWCFSPRGRYPGPTALVADLVLWNYLSAYGQQTQDAAILSDQQKTLDDLEQTQNELAESQAELADTQTQLRQTQQMLSQAVQDQITHQVQQAMNTTDPQAGLHVNQTLQDTNYVYAVNEDGLQATTADNSNCNLQQGDLLQLADGLPQTSDVAVRLKVIAANSLDCQAGSVIQVSRSKLQDMLNEFSRHTETAMQKADQYRQAGQLTTSGAP